MDEPAEIEDLDVWLAEQQQAAVDAGQTMDDAPSETADMAAGTEAVWRAMGR